LKGKAPMPTSTTRPMRSSRLMLRSNHPKRQYWHLLMFQLLYSILLQVKVKINMTMNILMTMITTMIVIMNILLIRS